MPRTSRNVDFGPGVLAMWESMKRGGLIHLVMASADANGHVKHVAREADYAQVKRDLDALEARAVKALRAVLLEMRDFLSAKVRSSRKLSDLVRNLGFSARVRGDLRRACAELLRRAWDMGSRDAKREARAGQQAVRQHDALPSFTPIAALKWLNDKSFWISGVLSDKVLADAKGVLINGIKTGKGNQEMIDELAKLFLPYIGDASIIEDGDLLSPWRLENIIRTNATDAYNHGRLTEFRDQDLADGLVGVRYSAVLDERTTEVCRFLDGFLFKVGSPDLDELTPPNHFQCRSIIVPVVAGEQVDLNDFITPEQVGTAKGLADGKFLADRSLWSNYSEREEATEDEVVALRARLAEAEERPKPQPARRTEVMVERTADGKFKATRVERDADDK